MNFREFIKTESEPVRGTAKSGCGNLRGGKRKKRCGVV